MITQYYEHHTVVLRNAIILYYIIPSQMFLEDTLPPYSMPFASPLMYLRLYRSVSTRSIVPSVTRRDCTWPLWEGLEVCVCVCVCVCQYAYMCACVLHDCVCLGVCEHVCVCHTCWYFSVVA